MLTPKNPTTKAHEDIEESGGTARSTPRDGNAKPPRLEPVEEDSPDDGLKLSKKFEGRGGYEYEEMDNGDFKIVKSPRSQGGQVISKDSEFWDHIKREQGEVKGGGISREDHRRESLVDARKKAAEQGAQAADPYSEFYSPHQTSMRGIVRNKMNPPKDVEAPEQEPDDDKALVSSMVKRSGDAAHVEDMVEKSGVSRMVEKSAEDAEAELSQDQKDVRDIIIKNGTSAEDATTFVEAMDATVLQAIKKASGGKSDKPSDVTKMPIKAARGAAAKAALNG